MADYHSNCWTTGQSVACTHKVNGICLYQITNIRELGKLCVCLTKEAKHARTNPTPRAEWSSFRWKITHLSSGGATVATQGHGAGGRSQFNVIYDVTFNHNQSLCFFNYKEKEQHWGNKPICINWPAVSTYILHTIHELRILFLKTKKIQIKFFSIFLVRVARGVDDAMATFRQKFGDFIFFRVLHPHGFRVLRHREKCGWLGKHDFFQGHSFLFFFPLFPFVVDV